MLIPFAYYDFFNTEENIRELYFFLTELIISHILRNAYSKKKYIPSSFLLSWNTSYTFGIKISV